MEEIDAMAGEAVELRGPCPRPIVDMLDAVSNARVISRTQLVNEILAKWATGALHEATVVCRAMRVNALDSSKNGKG